MLENFLLSSQALQFRVKISYDNNAGSIFINNFFKKLGQSVSRFDRGLLYHRYFGAGA